MNFKISNKRLSLLLSLTMILMTYPLTFGSTVRVAEIKSMSGDVQLQKGGGEKIFNAFVGMALTQGDIIITGRNGRVTVKIDKGLEFIISENSQIVISELIKNQDHESTQLSVQSGGLWSRIKRSISPKSRYEIKTPTVVMGARGTEFYTRVSGAEVDVSVFSGLVAVTGYEVIMNESGAEIALEILIGVDEYLRVVGKPKEIGDFIKETLDLNKLDLFGLETIKVLAEEEPNIFDKWVNEELDNRIKEERKKIQDELERKEEEIKKAIESIHDIPSTENNIIYFDEPEEKPEDPPKLQVPDPIFDPTPTVPVLPAILVNDFLNGRNEVALPLGSNEELILTVIPHQANLSAESLNEELLNAHLEQVEDGYHLILSSNESIGKAQVRLTANASGYQNFIKVFDVLVVQSNSPDPEDPEEEIPIPSMIPSGAELCKDVDWGEDIYAYIFSEGNYSTLYLFGHVQESEPLKDINNFTSNSNQNFFTQSNIKSVIIVEGIGTIGEYAFSGSQLEFLSLSEDLVTIKRGAFIENNLLSLVIPESVEVIERDAFMRNQITSIEIKAPNISLPQPDGILKENGINRNSFCIVDRGLQNYTGTWTIKRDNDKDWYHETETTYLNGLPFAAVPFTSVSWGDGIEAYQEGNKLYLVGSQSENLVTMNSFMDVSGHAEKFSEISEVYILSGIANVGDYAFANTQINLVNLGTSVTTIGEGAFMENNLLTLVIPENVEIIGRNAFMRNQITSIEIKAPNISLPQPDGILKENGINRNSFCIVDRGFQSYTGTWTIKRDNDKDWYHETETTYLNGLPFAAVPFISVSWGDGIEAYQEGNKLYLMGSQSENLVTMNSFMDVSGHAEKFSEISEVYILSGIDNVGAFAFANTQINLVNLGTSVTTIGQSAFMGNTLTSLVIPESVTSIGEAAFNENLLTQVIFLGASTYLNGQMIFSSNGPEGNSLSFYEQDPSYLQGTWIVENQSGEYIWIKQP